MHTEEQIKEAQGTFSPAGSRVAILIDEFKYEGRLAIPETAKRLPTTGTIVSLGPLVDTVVYEYDEVLSTVPFYKIGDRVLVTMYSGTLVCIQNRPAFRVVEAAEILGKIAKDDTLDYTGA